MGAWTLTIIGEDVEANLGPAIVALVTELNKVGHRVNTARILTDNGEKPIDVSSLAVAPAPAPTPEATTPIPDAPVDTSTAAVLDPPTTEGATNG